MANSLALIYFNACGLECFVSTLVVLSYYLYINNNNVLYVRRTLGGILDEKSHCYTLEVSFYSYTTTSGTSTVTQPYNEEACILYSLRAISDSPRLLNV